MNYDSYGLFTRTNICRQGKFLLMMPSYHQMRSEERLTARLS